MESQVFSLDLPQSFSSVINAQSTSLLNYELEFVAKRIVSVMATLGDYPYIRYYSPPTSTTTLVSSSGSNKTNLSGKLADLVQSELDTRKTNTLKK
jgi:syntaxin-binding protein 1